MQTSANAFVLMPFDDDFVPVYTGLIKHSLEPIGFVVQRADDIDSQRNILQDILDKISNSDLVVADLTGLNPNVFYELGLAHAFRKPVILLTQVIEDVPFDLKSYRIIQYSTHFDTIDRARETLKSYGEGFLRGDIHFGSPVTDFLSSDDSSETAGHSVNVPIQLTDGDDDSGFLDHTIALQEGNDRIAKIIKGSTIDLKDLTDSIVTSTAELNRLNSNPNADTPRAARAISRRLAAKIDDFAQKIKKANYEYTDLLWGMEDSLEFVIAFQMQDLNDSEGTEKLLVQLEDFLEIASDARDSFLNLALQMDYVPRMERRLNRALGSGSLETRTMASNIERHAAAVSRVQQKYS